MDLLLASMIVFSEIAWGGSSLSTADEWFELLNPTDHAVDVSGWRIEGASAEPIVLPAGTVVASHATFLVSNYPESEPRTTLAAVPHLVTTAVALSNSALHLRIYDASGNLVDEAGTTGAAPFAGQSGTPKKSMERVWPLTLGNVPEAWRSADASNGFDAGATELGTPGSFLMPEPPAEPETESPPASPSGEGEEDTEPDPIVSEPIEPGPTEPAPTEPEQTEPAPTEPEPVPETPETPPIQEELPVPTVPEEPVEDPDENEAPPDETRPPSAVRISEIYSAPKSGADEWLELVNRSGFDETLAGWILRDAGEAETNLSGLIPAWGHIVIVKPKGSLNNGGDTVTLLDDRRVEIDVVTFGKLKSDESLARIEDEDAFVITVTPTRGEVNVITERPVPPSPAPKAIATAKPVPKPKVIPAPKPKPAAPTSKPATVAMSTPARVTTPAKGSLPAKAGTGVQKAAKLIDPSTALRSAQDDNSGKAKPKTTAKKSKYKGDPYEAVVAIAPGVYAKARFKAFVGEELREIRLSKSAAFGLEPGTRFTFIAQEKSDDAGTFLLANPNSVTVLDEADAYEFPPLSDWPEASGPAELDAEVVSIDGKRLRVSVSGQEGFVELPPALSKPPLKNGDSVRVRGFVAVASETPIVWLPDEESLVLVKGYQSAAKPAAPEKLPFIPMAAITAALAGLGIAAYLRRERMRRELMLSARDME